MNDARVKADVEFGAGTEGEFQLIVYLDVARVDSLHRSIHDREVLSSPNHVGIGEPQCIFHTPTMGFAEGSVECDTCQ